MTRTATVTVWTKESTKTVEDVIHSETEFGDETTVRLEQDDGTIIEHTGPGVTITGFTLTGE